MGRTRGLGVRIALPELPQQLPQHVPFRLKNQGSHTPDHCMSIACLLHTIAYSILSFAHSAHLLYSLLAGFALVFPHPTKKGGVFSLGARRAAVPQNLLIWLPAMLSTMHAHATPMPPVNRLPRCCAPRRIGLLWGFLGRCPPGCPNRPILLRQRVGRIRLDAQGAGR